MKIRIPDKFRSVKAAAAAVIGVLILIMIFWLSKSVFTTGSYYYPTETFVQLENGQPVSQVLYAPGDNPVLRSVSVLFATNARSNEGDVTVELMAGDDVICDWHIKASELLDNAIRGFEAPDGIKLSRDELYTIRITETFEGENNIAVGASSTGYLSCSMTTYDSSRCFKWFALMSLIFAAGYIVLILKGGFLDGSVSRIVITGIVSVLVIFILQFDFFPRISKTVASKPVPSATGVWDTIEPGASKEYSFSCRYDPFEDLEIFTNGENACDYEVTLVNDTTGVTYFDHMPVVPGWRVSTGRLCMMLSTEYSASGERYYDDGDYTLIITNTSADKAMEIELESPVEDGQTGVVAFAGLRSTTLGVKVATFAVILIFAYLIVLSVFRTAGRLTVERFYLITVIPLSVLYLIVFQPWTVPDCGAHFLASYRASNLLLGINGRLQWFARECDAVYYNGISWWTERKPDLEGIASMMHGIRQNSITTGLVDQLPHEDKMVYYSTLNWLPQSVGLAAGRLMRLGPALTVLIARVLTLITYIACTYRAVRNTPVGKSVFAALALLPVSLMMSSSFSYDCMVIIVALNFTAIILKLRAGYSRAGLIEAVIWAFLLGATKGGSVLLLLPLALLLIKKDKKHLILAGSVIGTALLSVLIFDKILPSDELFQFGEENSGYMMTAFSCQHPTEYLRMLVRTYLYFGDTYVNQALGRELSYLEETISSAVVIGAMLSALVYSTFEKDTLELKKADRIVFVVLTVMAFVMTPAMLLSYTPVGSGMIYGVQGRYLFPVMSLLLLAVTKFGLHKSRVRTADKDRTASVNACINAYVTFTVIMIYMMLKLYLSR